MVHIEDIPCMNETIRRLTSMGREEMPDAPGIDRFNYDPDVEEVAEDAEAVESPTEDAEAITAVQDPSVDPQGGI
jgi:hypothetical protein